MTLAEAKDEARRLMQTFNAACIARQCRPGECLDGCEARIEIIARAIIPETPTNSSIS